MRFRQYPIIMGLGTKILTAYHYPNFRDGLIVGILDSKTKFPKGKHIDNQEFKQSASTIRAKFYFVELEDLDRFIGNLELLRNQWAEQLKEQKNE